MRLTKKQVKADILETTTIKELMAAYEEIAAIRMKRIRDQVLKSRDFHAILSHYFHEIHAAHTKHETAIVKPTNEEHIVILLSDDKGLYGDILHKTRDAFVQFVESHPDYKLAVIGVLEEERLKTALAGREIQFFPLANATTNLMQIEGLIDLLSSYAYVTVFHGKFMSLINQVPEASDLTGEEESEATPGVIRQYILEPSSESLKAFFQKEIITLLFDQALFEGTLAKEASRMISLEKATDEARNRLKNLERSSRLINAQHQNKEQITYLAGLSLWKIQ